MKHWDFRDVSLITDLEGRLECHMDDYGNDKHAQILSGAIALLTDNPEMAEQIWETFMNLLDCASRDDANHFYGFIIKRH
jgi:predicted RecB family nuclease